MSEGALTKDFDLVRGKWRINASLPGYKVVCCALEGLRHRLFPLRQVHGMPTWYYYYSNSVYIYPPPLHTWRLLLTYEPREETRTRNVPGEFTGANCSN